MSRLFPYVRVRTVAGPDATVGAALDAAEESLSAAGFVTLGRYAPRSSADGSGDARAVLVVTSDVVRGAIRAAGLDGLAAAASGILRVAATQPADGGDVAVTRTSAAYWGAAMFAKTAGAPTAEALEALDAEFGAAAGDANDSESAPFGHGKGFRDKDMRGFHYMFGMPYLADTARVGRFGSHDEAAAAVAKALDADGECSTVYAERHEDGEGRVSTCFGVALGGAKGEARFLPIIDGAAADKHTAALPYELVVLHDGRVVMPHGRFRIAVAWPALTMATFTKIMSTPDDIAAVGKRLCGGK